MGRRGERENKETYREQFVIVPFTQLPVVASHEPGLHTSPDEQSFALFKQPAIVSQVSYKRIRNRKAHNKLTEEKEKKLCDLQLCTGCHRHRK
jgi:hypothetical protein